MKPKLPPHDIETERSVLGAVLIDVEAIIKVSELLKPDDFYSREHQIIYEAMETLYEKREPIDVVTLTGQLKKMKRLNDAGGTTAIAKLSNILSTAANVESYAKLVREHSVKRRLISLGAEMSDLAFDESKNVKDILDMAEQKVLAVSQVNTIKGFIPIKDTLVESFDRLDELQRSGGELRGLPTGFSDLDAMLAGLQRSNLIILAARPGMGKTAFSLNIAQNAAVLAKKKVGFFSLEMSKEELVDRLLVSQANIDAWRLKTGRLDQQDFLKLSDAMGVLAEAHIYIDDTPGLSVYEMRTKARRLMIEHQVDMIVVDYLQLAHGKTSDNRVQEVAEISQGLKNIARELRIPVLALSQLSRAIESRGEKNPQLSDLRESGCLAGDTMVYMADSGRYKRMDELVGKTGLKVLAMNPANLKLESKEVTHAFCTGTKEVFKMKTQLGREIKATANHKFYTANGWKRLDELQVGEMLAIPRRLGEVTKQALTDSELALMAHLIGDGCTLPKHAVQYTTNQNELAEIVVDLAKKVFGERISPRVKVEKNWLQVYLASAEKLARGKYNPVKTWLEKLGIWGLRSGEKYIPRKVFSVPNEKIGLFLRHLWSTDGCVNCKDGEKSGVNPRVYYATSSEKLAFGVQSLLLRLNINARLKKVSQGEKGKDQYHVIVSGQSDLKLFVEVVGAVGDKNIRHIHEIKKYLDLRKENTNRDVIPKMVWRSFVVPAMKKNGLSAREMQAKLGMSYCGTALYKSNLSRKRAQKVAEIVSSVELARFSQSDLYWDPISSIEPCGEEMVYDLTILDHSNFVAGNMIVHNSIEQDADVVMFLYRKDEDIRESVTLKIAKHRNGSVGEIDLFFRGDRIKFFGMEKKMG